MEPIKKVDKGGPNISHISFPLPDPARPWGSPNCKESNGTYSGHFLDPRVAMLSSLPRTHKPSSVSLKEEHQKIKDKPSNVDT